MLNKLISLAVVVAIAYLVFTRVVPWVQTEFGSAGSTPPPGASESAVCLDAAEAANENLARTARNFGSPPADLDAWSTAVSEVERALRAAQGACACMTPACGKASEAVSEMQSQLWSLDNLIRSSSTGFSNPARQQERIHSLLAEARAALP